MLKSYINEVFITYDTNNTGTLNPSQLTQFFNDLFKSLNVPITISQQQAVEAIRSVDNNFSGNANR